MKSKVRLIRALWTLLMVFYALSFVFFIIVMNHYAIASPYLGQLAKSAYISVPVVIVLGVFVVKSLAEKEPVRPCIKVPFLILTLPVIIVPVAALIVSL
ncbi:MAG: hypothetical protein J6330_06505 [Clostridia bacterium]|nr:hypothetical protein [Clostridia bacterium]